jgi:hypothetical protein
MSSLEVLADKIKPMDALAISGSLDSFVTKRVEFEEFQGIRTYGASPLASVTGSGTITQQAQSFTLTNTAILKEIELGLGRNGNDNSATMAVDICSDSAGSPGAVIATSVFYRYGLLVGFANTVVVNKQATRIFKFQGSITLSASTTYWWVLRYQVASVSGNDILILGTSKSTLITPYIQHDLGGVSKSFNGSVWSSAATYDLYYVLRGNAVEGITQAQHDTDFLIDSSSKRVSQSFTTGPGFSIAAVEWTLLQEGGPGVSFLCDVCVDSAGNPGTVLGTSRAIPASQGGILVDVAGSQPAAPVMFHFITAVTLLPATKYHIVFRPTSGSMDGINSMTVRYKNSDVMAGGNFLTSSNSGSTWTPLTADAAICIYSQGKMQPYYSDSYGNTMVGGKVAGKRLQVSGGIRVSDLAAVSANIPTSLIISDGLGTLSPTNSASLSSLIMYGPSANINITAAPSASYSLVLPSTQGAASTFLQNNGGGNLSWVAAGGGGGTPFKEDKTLSSTDITNGYVDLTHLTLSGSMDIWWDGFHLTEGVEYSLSTVGGVTRVTWIGDLLPAGATPLVAGETLNTEYFY